MLVYELQHCASTKYSLLKAEELFSFLLFAVLAY